MPDDHSISPPRVSEQFVLAKAEYFVDVQLWPRETKLDPRGWLSNFRDDEKDHAIHLLNAFLYYSADLTDELFKAAFQQLSRKIVPISGPYVAAQAAWRQFRSDVIVTHVTGEKPSNTDSGYLFARKARQVLKIDENNIMDSAKVLQRLSDEGARPILFVDDFVGSGGQFNRTWRRDVKLRDGSVLSFKRFAGVSGSSFYYCPLICGSKGREVIEMECPEVVLSPAHFLSDRYSALSDESVVWPDHLRSSAHDFLQTVSSRAGISKSRRTGITNWKGYQDQALTLAFEHGVPDATLPIYYHDENGWIPFIKRT